jgi:hypothetical protein
MGWNTWRSHVVSAYVNTTTLLVEREFLSRIRAKASAGGDGDFYDDLVRKVVARAATWRNVDDADEHEDGGLFSREEHAKLLQDKQRTLETIEKERRVRAAGGRTDGSISDNT